MNSFSGKDCYATVCNKNSDEKVRSERGSTQKRMKIKKYEKQEKPEQVSHQCCRHFCANLSHDLSSRLRDRQKKFRQRNKNIDSQTI